MIRGRKQIQITRAPRIEVAAPGDEVANYRTYIKI
jgi:hypothetical protein